MTRIGLISADFQVYINMFLCTYVLYLFLCTYVIYMFLCTYVIYLFLCTYVIYSIGQGFALKMLILITVRLQIRPSGYLEQGPRLSAKSAGTKNFHCLKCRNHIMPFTHQSLNPTHRTLKYSPKYREVYFFLSSF